MQEATLLDAQELMKTMLRDIDEICRNNDIEYWIESGTLLGAVRHGGFIPWDDDIDIGMIRKDYDKFIEIANEYLPTDLFLQNAQLDSGVEYSWTKVKHSHSEILEEYNQDCHKGIFIDIFPYDYYNCNLKDKGYITKKSSVIRNKIFFVANLNYDQFKAKTIIRNFKILSCKIIDKFIMRKTKNELIVYMQKKSKQYLDSGKFIGYGMEMGEFTLFMNEEFVFPLKKIEFQGLEVMCPNNPEKYLVALYGENYMEIPKVEDQYCHNNGVYIYKNRK